MMPLTDDAITDAITEIAIETSKRQRAEAHGAQSHARCRQSGRSASHGLHLAWKDLRVCEPPK